MKRIYLMISMAAFCLAAFFAPAAAQQAAPYEVEYQTAPKYKDFRFAIGGGYAYRLGKEEKTGNAALDAMNKKLRHGFTVDADAQYFFKETWGLGLNANFYSASTSGENIRLPDVDNAMNLKEVQSVIYIGPSFVGRNESEKFMLITNIGLGPIFFNTDMNFSGQSLVGKQTTLGVNAGIAGEYKLNGKTGIGLKLSYVMGTINSINIEGQKIQKEQEVSVSNLMATLFISFRSW